MISLRWHERPACGCLITFFSYQLGKNTGETLAPEKKTVSTFLRKQTTPSKILSNFRHPDRGGEFFTSSRLLKFDFLICNTNSFSISIHHKNSPPLEGWIFSKKNDGVV